ncbi:hypothetical protein ALI144C_09205 [Actinosynnema sp. ALI-1.44]|uniref:hypothetical protein n=1 Tax=Actinosynnema sp. ALI-1.44 TaxID=1933779 RepID=UPI00097C7EE0|nr:hypothetical protein [Actinosynnema sp. ALI-1.44]ONI87550.1 hypothetical protein ALI144C_09205 [Actinosynnema sp. ALI-1.44]
MATRCSGGREGAPARHRGTGDEIAKRSSTAWIEEQARKLKARSDAQLATEQRLLARGLELLGGRWVYRAHKSTTFPLFAQWDASGKKFNILDKKTWRPTGKSIADNGTLSA